MRKPTICMGENKDADQLRGNREADQRLCFRYTDSTFPPLLIPKFSRFWVSSVTVQAGLCWTWSETQIVGFVMHRLKYYWLIRTFLSLLRGTEDIFVSLTWLKTFFATRLCRYRNIFIYEVLTAFFKFMTITFQNYFYRLNARLFIIQFIFYYLLVSWSKIHDCVSPQASMYAFLKVWICFCTTTFSMNVADSP